MPKATFRHLSVTGLSSCTGPIVRTLDDEAHLYAENPVQLERIRKLVGIESRSIAPPGVTTLDLCEAAARRLLSEMKIDPSSVDAVICVTQTPDHWQPCNANLLHGRLDLPKSAAAFDINQGCSGWVYGLYVAGTMIEAGGCSRVLLVAGDTVTQTIHPRDRGVVPLFGDAGTATLIDRRETASPAFFSLHSDGKGHAAIKIPAGGYRQPASPATKQEHTDAEGNVRTPEHLFMNGIEVFNFTLREEPGAVRELLAYAGVDAGQVDSFVFHQANEFILTNLAKRLKLPPEKVPTRTVRYHGNQSSASVPSAICDALGGKLIDGEQMVLCSGFGVGLSWASCLFRLGPLQHCSIFPLPFPPSTMS